MKLLDKIFGAKSEVYNVNILNSRSVGRLFLVPITQTQLNKQNAMLGIHSYQKSGEL